MSKCPKCKKPIEANSTFCEKCGHNLKKPLTKITAGLVFGYIVGMILLIAGISFMFGGHFLIGVLTFFSSIFIIPHFAKPIGEYLHIEISEGIKIILTIVLLIIIGYSFNSNEKTTIYSAVTEDYASNNYPSTTTTELPAKVTNCIELVKYNDRRNEYGWLVIAGTVKNICTTEETGKIHFILYDSSGNVLTSDYTYAEPWDLQPGAIHGFEKTWTDETVYNNVAKYEIYTSHSTF